MKTFWYHFNKPASKAKGKPQITIHYDKICHIVDNLIINVKTFGRIRKQQPRFVVVGKCSKFEVVNGVGIIS